MNTANDDDLMSRFDDVEVSTFRKVPICLVLDVSKSMECRDGSTLTKIELLNEFYNGFISFVRLDKRAKEMVDFCAITFGGEVTVINEWSNINSINTIKFFPKGAKPIGAAMEKACELIDSRRIFYKDKGFEYYKPIVILISDGETTNDYKSVAQEVSKKVKLKSGGIRVIPIIIGQNIYSKTVAAFSPIYIPKATCSSDELIDVPKNLFFSLFASD
jgi:uncharacterized protein YegL